MMNKRFHVSKTKDYNDYPDSVNNQFLDCNGVTVLTPHKGKLDPF